MEQISERFSLMSELLIAAHHLYSWTLGPDFERISVSCPESEFFYNLFLMSSSSREIKEHFQHSEMPLVCADRIGIGWIAQYWDKTYYLLGPFFIMAASETYIRNICYEAKFPSSMVNPFLVHLQLLPVIHVQETVAYGIMLYRCLSGLTIKANDIEVYYEEGAVPREESWNSSTWHGTYQAERKLVEAIKKGDLNAFNEIAKSISQSQVGIMSGKGDPLRQIKNGGIVFATIISRAAMEAGVSPEGSYNLSDYYIQKIEASRFVSDAQQIIEEMTYSFFQRIRHVKTNSDCSRAVRIAAEYIETHLREKISLDQIAKEAGYASYYLSGKFQKEMGESINSYIRRRKIELAKELMLEGRKTTVDIADELCFSSPSYFAATFRKYTGMSPTEFIDGNEKAGL